MGIQVFFASLLCRFLKAVARVAHRGGTAMPGRYALKLCPDLLKVLARDVHVVAITGTNGKTTSSRMVEEAFEEAGLDYISNRSGANLISGITTEFVMNATLAGRPKKHYAVIECDEAAARKVFGQLRPEVVLVTNLFRDQLDRYGEVTHTLGNIREGLKGTPESILCLNADCSLTSSLALELPNPMTYAHLGGYRCPQCGYRRPDADVAVTAVVRQTADSSVVDMDIFGEKRTVTVNLPAVYNIYNAAGAITAAVKMGIPLDTAVSALGRFNCGFGRMEKFDLGAGGTRMMLVKNPAGCNQVISFLREIGEDFTLVVCLNDRSADGTDISWIWDAEFEHLEEIRDRIRNVYVSGTRAGDMQLRMKYAGIDPEKIRLETDYARLVDAMAAQEVPVFIMPTYTAMLDLREHLIRRCGGADFWE